MLLALNNFTRPSIDYHFLNMNDGLVSIAFAATAADVRDAAVTE